MPSPRYPKPGEARSSLCVTGLSQQAQSCTQFVPMHDPDQALSLLPIGQSEHPDSPYYRCNYDLWQQGQLHPAPLSRNAVDKLAESRTTLEVKE